MAFDLRTLRSFLAVVSAGSISRAAERMHLAQPALSLQIKNLEIELGVELFDRMPKGVTPTAAGMLLVTHASDILKRVDVAYEALSQAVRTPAGRVAVGLPQSIAKLLTVPLVRECMARWPEIELQIIEMSTGYVPQNLLTGHVDIGVTFGAMPETGLRCELLIEEDLILVGAPGSLPALCAGALGDEAKIAVTELAALPLILPAGLHGLRALIETYASASGVALRVMAEVNAIPELIALASAGVGLTILSHASVQAELAAGTLAAARIVAPEMSRQVFICRSATLPATLAGTAIWDTMLRITRTLVDAGQWPARLACANKGREPAAAA
jgi:LysR family nitrogen assimilation transcriptional regulator